MSVSYLRNEFYVWSDGKCMNLSVGRRSKYHSKYKPGLTNAEWRRIEPDLVVIPLASFDEVVRQRVNEILYNTVVAEKNDENN